MRKSLQVLLGLKALVTAALPDADIKGFDRELSITIEPGAGGTVIGHPGDPGDPEADLSPLTYYYEHRFPMEILAPRGPGSDEAASAAIDAMLRPIGAAVKADRTLGGLCDYLEVTATDVEDGIAPRGAGEQRWAGFAFIAHYSTPDPLGG